MRGYTAKVGLRKPDRRAAVLAKLEALRGVPYEWPRAEYENPDWLRDQIRRLAATAIAHRTAVRAMLGEVAQESAQHWQGGGFKP